MTITTNKTKFVEDFTRFLSIMEKGLKKKGVYEPQKNTIQEFRRWMKEEITSFDVRNANEQMMNKIEYELSIGNNDKVLFAIDSYFKMWLMNNTPKVNKNIWFHGTTAEKYIAMELDKEIRPSTAASAQHEGHSRDIGTISLARDKGDALFFSVISKNNIKRMILHIDISSLDPRFMVYRELFGKQNAELMYYKPIPIEAVKERTISKLLGP